VDSYSVSLAAGAEKELFGLPQNVIARMVPRLERLAATPRPPGCKKLVGGHNEWRIRVGDYRVVYEIDDKSRTVEVTRIAHRREVYS
jgi:mRNA interferase RelE/StbE